jgi:hypothetical protein
MGLMQTGYSRSPKLLKGALIQFSAPMLVPVPNIILFQYNPETMTRTLAPWAPPTREATYKEKDGAFAGEMAMLSKEQVNSLRQPYDPDEAFSLVLELDAADALEHPLTHPVAVLAGVADRIAALEMLCYPPTDDSAAGGLLNVDVSVSVGAGGVDIGGGASKKTDVVPRREVPVVLFFWGPGRIVPVRITAFSIEEQQYSPLLYPLRARVTLGMKVITDTQMVDATGGFAEGAVVDIAKACYKFTMVQKKALALANAANSLESAIGMLPI